jgi:hypothetical protein
MTPGEVKGLQALAMSQGGSLTINPETGLPEAGILKSLLPMIAGFFLGPAGIGLTAMQAGLTVGALGTAATGSLGKGFMMGLGAYGGAGLGAGLSSAGASSAPGAAANATTAGANTGAAATNNLSSSYSGLDKVASAGANTGATTGAATGTGTITASGAFEPYRAQGILNGPFAGTPVNASGYQLPNGTYATPPVPSAAPSVYRPDVFAGGSITPSAVPTSTLNTPVISTPTVSATPASTTPVASSSFGRFDDVGRGFDKATGSWEGAKEVWDLTPKGTGYGLAATGMSVLQSQQEEAAEEAKAKADAMAAARRGNVRPFDFSTEQDPSAYADTSTAESRYFVEPRFVARPIEKIAKDGGLMGYAVGGQVEEMSAANAMGSNTGYPMANLQTPMYANPQMARPVPTNVISPSGDTGVNTYSGEMRMAFGGSATAKAKEPTTDTKYSYNPETMQYTQATTVTPAASNNMQDIVRGFYAPVLDTLPHFRTMGGGKIPGLDANSINKFKQQIGAPQPTVTTQTMGGTIAPYTPLSGLAAADMSMVPNIQMQPRQDINQQLGLEAFYPMMEQQLAMKGSNLQAQGYADGGIARFDGGGMMKLTPEGQARQKYARENFEGIIPTVSDEDWNKYKKSQNLSFSAAAPAASTYKYNPATMQYTDNAGKVTGGMEQPFMPQMMLQQLTPEQQIGLTGYQGYAEGGTANGGYSLGSYSDGGRLLRGPGDGVSDSIPASIGDRQPARLADGEFVVPARIVSEIGNGSTEAGARKLYAMMDRVQKARKKTVGKSKVAVNTRADKLLPA